MEVNEFSYSALCRLGGGEVDEAQRKSEGYDRVGAVRDRGDDAVGAPTTPSKRPEQVLVLVSVGDDVGPIGFDDGELKGVVDA